MTNILCSCFDPKNAYKCINNQSQQFADSAIMATIYEKSKFTLINGLIWKNIGCITYALQRCPILPITINEFVNNDVFATTITNPYCKTSIPSDNIIDVTLINSYKKCITYDAILVTPKTSCQFNVSTNSTNITQTSQHLIGTTKMAILSNITNTTLMFPTPTISTNVLMINTMGFPSTLYHSTLTKVCTNYELNYGTSFSNKTAFIPISSSEVPVTTYSQQVYAQPVVYRSVIIDDSIIITDMINMMLQDGLSNGQTINSFTTEDFIGTNYNDLLQMLTKASITIGACQESYLILQDPTTMTLCIYVKPNNTISSIVNNFNNEGILLVYEGDTIVIEINLEQHVESGSGIC